MSRIGTIARRTFLVASTAIVGGVAFGYYAYKRPVANPLLDGLAEGGMTVGPAGDTLMSGLKDVGATMTAEWLEAAGDKGAAIVDAFKSMQ